METHTELVTPLKQAKTGNILLLFRLPTGSNA